MLIRAHRGELLPHRSARVAKGTVQSLANLYRVTPRYVWLTIAGLLLLRFAVAPFVVLIPEEAYYWMYSQYPALGYLDHPPMVAWLILAGTTLLGDVELGVRLGTLLLTATSTDRKSVV